MPGAELEEVATEDTFLGNIKVKVGPITATYKGRVRFTQVDRENYAIQMTGEGREVGGGTARGTVSSRLQQAPDGRTEVAAEASAEITGRVMQFGRGMIQGVSEQLFEQFAAAVAQRSLPDRVVPDDPHVVGLRASARSGRPSGGVGRVAAQLVPAAVRPRIPVRARSCPVARHGRMGSYCGAVEAAS